MTVFLGCVIRSIRRNDVDQRLPPLIDHGIAGARQSVGQVGGIFHALGMGALRPRHFVIGRGRIEIGENAAVGFAGGAISDQGQGAACQTEAKTVPTAAEAYFASPTLGNGAYPATPGTAMWTGPNNLMSAAPTLVSYTGSGTSYGLTYAAKCLAVTPALPAP